MQSAVRQARLRTSAASSTGGVQQRKGAAPGAYSTRSSDKRRQLRNARDNSRTSQQASASQASVKQASAGSMGTLRPPQQQAVPLNSQGRAGMSKAVPLMRQADVNSNSMKREQPVEQVRNGTPQQRLERLRPARGYLCVCGLEEPCL